MGWAFALFDHLAGVADLLPRQFRLSPQSHPPPPRRFDPGAGALDDQ